MEKSIGVKKINIAVFISGKGSNLKNLINHSFKKYSKFKVCLVISNESKAEGLKYAKKFKRICSSLPKSFGNISNIHLSHGKGTQSYKSQHAHRVDMVHKA